MEHTDTPVVEAWLRDVSGRLAFDVGANAGQTSATLARNFERVVAFEPCADSFDLLEGLGLANVTPSLYAMSDHEGWATFNVATEAQAIGELVTGDRLGFSWGETTSQAEVMCSTLDAQVQTHGQPDFVKIDTEGHEVLVIEGGPALFTQHPPRLLVEVHAEENEGAIRRLLPHYAFQRVDHVAYALGSFERANHFWLWGEA